MCRVYCHNVYRVVVYVVYGSTFCLLLNNMDIQFVNTRRKILNHVICSILVECGYDTCEKQALETLTEMLQSCRF